MPQADVPKVHRDLTVDAARGIAIALVVLAHVTRGLFAADVLSTDGWAGALDLWLYSFFIPLFVFLSGLFVARSAERDGRMRFAIDRVADLMWLYLVWSLINGAVQVVFSRSTNGDTSVGEVLALWWPIGTMWFLPSLAFATIVVVACAPWRSRGRAGIVLVGLLMVALLTWRTFDGWPMAWLNPQLAFFLALGATIGHARLSSYLDRLPGPALLLITAVSLALTGFLLAEGASVPWAALLQPNDLIARGMGVICALLGIATVVTGSAIIARLWPPLVDGLGFLGQRSLPIYVSHTIFTAGARVALMAAGVTWGPLFVFFGIAAGIAGPLVLFALAQRLGFAWLFSRPTRTLGSVPAR